MQQPDDVYVLAVKRDERAGVPRDWLEVARGIPGVVILGEANPARVQIKATPEAIERLREQLSKYVHIEKVIPHERC
jgi:hypothetical protein